MQREEGGKTRLVWCPLAMGATLDGHLCKCRPNRRPEHTAALHSTLFRRRPMVGRWNNGGGYQAGHASRVLIITIAPGRPAIHSLGWQESHWRRRRPFITRARATAEFSFLINRPYTGDGMIASSIANHRTDKLALAVSRVLAGSLALHQAGEPASSLAQWLDG